MNQWGRDEMNLVELPFGPITGTKTKTFDVTHAMFDPILKRNVTRRTIITGSDAFGLPRPIDDQVLIGMKALTYESAFESRKVSFSRYQLCRTIGWSTDGRAYKRLEESLNRIAGTTLQFKDAWYDKGESEFKSKTFHLIEEVDLCSRDQLARSRVKSRQKEQRLCYFVWNEVIWKSFQDGFIRKLNMDLFRKITSGRRREVPLRLYRILDKRFYKSSTVRFDLEHLAIGILGLSPNYSPSQMKRVVDRAANWLVECGFLAGYTGEANCQSILFRKRVDRRPRRSGAASSVSIACGKVRENQAARWFAAQSPLQLAAWENDAIARHFGSDLERQLILSDRASQSKAQNGGAIRQNYIWRYWKEFISAAAA